MLRTLTLACALFCTFALCAQTNWTGNNGTNWTDAGNWDNGLPSAGNNATIPPTPASGNFPVISNFTGFSFTVNNFGTITVAGNGAIFHTGNLINQAGATFSINLNSNIFSNASGGMVSNFGTINNNGVFSNTNTGGTFINQAGGVFNNQNLLSNNGTSQITNFGTLNNFNQVLNMAAFANHGVLDNFDFFNNNAPAQNFGTWIIQTGGLLRNDDLFFNRPSGVINAIGNVLNNVEFTNDGGNINIIGNSEFNTRFLLKNTNGGTISNNGLIINTFCSTVINDALIANNTTFSNQGFVFDNGTIAPNTPVNINNGVVITPGNPNGLCQNLTKQLNQNGDPIIITAQELANPLIQFCGGYNLTVNGEQSITFTCADFGMNTVTVMIFDPFGGVTNCTATVIIEDPHFPVISCQNININLDQNGMASITPNQILASGFDNCNILNLTAVPSVFNCSLVGTNTVTLIAEDGHGNSTVCPAQVTINDVHQPELTCQNALLVLNDNGLATLQPSDVIASVSDNCGIAMTDIGQTTYDCSDIGTQQIIVKVFDPSGLSNWCNATVTVIDNIPPVIACKAPIMTHTEVGICEASVILAEPSILNENCGIQNIINNAPSLFALGTTTVTWFVTDLGGNTVSCQQTVTVQDVEAPSIFCPANVSIEPPLGTCSISGAIASVNAPVVSDNCGIANFFNNAPPTLEGGLHYVTWTVVDDAGNTNTCHQTIHVIDDEAPTISNCPSDQFSTISDECGTYVNWLEPFASDNCSVANFNSNSESGDFFEVGTTTVTYIAIDQSNNTTTCEFLVIVEDHEAPIFHTCPDDIFLFVDNCFETTSAFWDFPDIEDPCLQSTWVNDNWYPGDGFPVGTTEVVYSARDFSGNESQCSFEVIVESGLMINCPNDIYVSAADGLPEVTWNFPSTTSICDMCPDDHLPGFDYLGYFEGHQYYLSQQQATWGTGQDIAESYNGHLAVIESKRENTFLTSNLGNTDAWIGLSDDSSEGDFEWINDENLNYTNWHPAAPSNDEGKNFVLLFNNGAWFDGFNTSTHKYIVEIPCFDIEQTSGITNGETFVLGSNPITYTASDQCGNLCTCTFNIHVTTQSHVDYCTSEGGGDVWVERLKIATHTNQSGNDGGYGDYLNQTISATPFDCFFGLTPGGNYLNEKLYWRLWVDFNYDGDFYDEDEMVFQKVAIGNITELHNISGDLPAEATRLRIAVSRFGYPAPCGNFKHGEVEDYTIQFEDNLTGNNDVETDCEFKIRDFKATPGSQGVSLIWLADESCAVKEYFVEKSLNGTTFTSLENLNARSENTPSELYFSEDSRPIEGDNFYRIQARLEDGSLVKSPIQKVNFKIDLADFYLYPNPTNQSIFVHTEPFAGMETSIKIVNAFGQPLYEQQFESLPNKPIQINVQHFANGIYMLYLKSNKHREQSRRFVVAH